MVHRSFLSSPSIHAGKWIFGHAVWFAHQVAHTTHRMLLQASLYTRHWHQPALLKSPTRGQGGGWGNKFIILFPSSPHPISFPAVTGPKWKKIYIMPNLSLDHHFLKCPSLSYMASEAREQILLEMSKARETAHWPEILFGRWCLSVYSLRPHRPRPARLLCPGDSPGENTGVGCHALLQGTFPTQGLNPGVLIPLHCRQILYHWASGEAHDKPRQHIKEQRHHAGDKALQCRNYGFPVVVYRCVSWIIKKELWC